MAFLMYSPSEKEKTDFLQVHFANCPKHESKVVGKLVPNLIYQLIDRLYEIHELVAKQSKSVTKSLYSV